MDDEIKTDDNLLQKNELDEIKEKMKSMRSSITELNNDLIDHRLSNCDAFEEINGILESMIDSVKKLNNVYNHINRILLVVLYILSINVTITVVMVILFLICR